MKDETYVFISDVREKAITRRSARHKRTHCGKGGSVRLPSDNLTKKEMKKMNGECTSYRLNEPMNWTEFKAMPDDVKVTYIKLLQSKWNVPVSKIGEMMGVSQSSIQKESARLGLVFGKGMTRKNWDKDGFYTWVAGSRVAEEPVVEKPVKTLAGVANELSEEVCRILRESVEEPEIKNEFPALIIPEYNPVHQTAVPERGQLEFKCPANVALDTIKQILANEMVEIRVSWRVIDGD